MQTAIVIVIIAVAIFYVARMFRPSKLKSESPCGSCSGCSAGNPPEFNTRPDAFTGRGTCCSGAEDPDNCPHCPEDDSDNSEESTKNKRQI